MKRIEDLTGSGRLNLQEPDAGDSDPATAETNGSGARSPNQQRQCRGIPRVDLRARGMSKERMGVNGVERQAEMKQLARERERERERELTRLSVAL